MDAKWSEKSEKEWLDLARQHSFRSRFDKATFTGPVLVWGRGSVVRDVNGREYLDFNSGQMCAALGHNHPKIIRAIQESCDRIIHSHASIFNEKEILLASPGRCSAGRVWLKQAEAELDQSELGGQDASGPGRLREP
jgi:4-aminobutyrate aminotransferase-like enzyme